MIRLVVTDEKSLRADAADLVGTVLNDIHHELRSTPYMFVVDETCQKHGLDFTPSR